MALESLRLATRAGIGALLLAGFAGCGQNQKTFVAEQRAAAVGYRLEYFERERLLFVHRPNGERDGVELATLQGVFLHRQAGSDSVDGKARYFWRFARPQGVVSAPFFSVEPSTVIGILKGELAGFDEVAAMKMSRAFERGTSSFCLVWGSAEYLKENRMNKEQDCRP